MISEVLQTRSRIELTGNQETCIKAMKPAVHQPPNKEPTVQLSQTMRAIQKACLALRNTPDIDMNKITSIKQAIQDGQYVMDTTEIARKLLSSS